MIDLTIELASVAGLAGAVVVTAIRFTWWLGDRLDKITTAQVKSVSEVKEANALALAEHERRDQSRHEENIVRFARLEAKLGDTKNRIP